MAMLSLRLHGYSLILSAVAAASVLRAAVASFMATSSSKQKVSQPTCERETCVYLYTLQTYGNITEFCFSCPLPDLTLGAGVRGKPLCCTLKMSHYFHYTHIEHLCCPQLEGLLLASQLISTGQFYQALPTQLRQKVIHVLPKCTKVWISTGPKSKHSKAGKDKKS